MKRPRTAEREEVSARAQAPEHFGPHLGAWNAVVPRMTHERKAIRRIRERTVIVVTGQRAKDGERVALVDGVTRHARTSRTIQ
jgi:hypothetical protein